MRNTFYKLSYPVFFLIILAAFQQSLHAQSFIWVKSYGGADKDKGKDLGVDQFGNAFVAGFFRNQMTLGSIDLQATGGDTDEDVFIAKLDVAGNPVWAHNMGNGLNEHEDFPLGMSVNENGWSATSGKCFQYLKLDNGDSIPGYGNDDMFLVTYDPDGNLNWAKVGGGDGDELGSATFVDNSQNVYCCGNFRGPIDFYGDSLITVANDPHFYCAKYNWEGKLLWVKWFSASSLSLIHI